MANVFISSTGRDLSAYRDAAIEICNRLFLIPNAMEFFEAMGAGATKGSKRKLDDADVYVGIFAHRYGYIEDGYDKSVTEVEFDYAGKRGIDRLCFLVKPDEAWPPDSWDYQNYDKLEAFKSRIDTSLIRDHFTTVDDFKFKLMQALVEWLKKSGILGTPEVSGSGLESVATATPRPALVIGRDGDVNNLKLRLGIVSKDQKRDLTIIRGWPGVGKTTLVTALAHDPEVVAAFPDGILWTALAESGNAYSSLHTWGRQFGTLDIGLTLDKAIDRMRAILSRKRILLIVDDAWETDQVIPFKQIIGIDCALFITTRFGEVARDLQNVPDDVYVLDVLASDKALYLLRQLAPTVVQYNLDKALQLVKDLEGLPLAIKVAGRVLEAEMELGGDVLSLMDELRESHRLLEEKAPDDRFDPHIGTTPTIKLLLQRSTDRLDEPTRERFAMLGVFAPNPATFDLEALRAVWLDDNPLPTVRKLANCGLLEPIPAQGRFQMHAILVKHANSLLGA